MKTLESHGTLPFLDTRRQLTCAPIGRNGGMLIVTRTLALHCRPASLIRLQLDIENFDIRGMTVHSDKVLVQRT
jgi:hypothetical protein